MGGRDSRRRAGPALRQGGRRSRRRRPLDAGGLARLARGRPSDSQQGVPTRSVLAAGRAPARGAADSRRLPRRGRVRLRRQRGAGARDRAAMAVGRADDRAGGGSRRAVLLGPPGLRQLSGPDKRRLSASSVAHLLAQASLPASLKCLLPGPLRAVLLSAMVALAGCGGLGQGTAAPGGPTPPGPRAARRGTPPPLR